jgi:hypothetical protein
MWTINSRSIGSLPARRAGAYRETIRLQSLADPILGGIRDAAELTGKAEDEEDRRIDAQGDAGVAPFDPCNGIASHEGALRD